MSTLFHNVLTKIAQVGLHPSPETQATIDLLDNPHYTVAVVGKFQVGKTTLLNKVFLREKVLLEGIGICRTAVPTEIQYGDAKQMTVFYRDGLSLQPLPELTRVVDNPSQNDLEKVTTASSPDERWALSKKTENVQVKWPCETLKGYSLFDTPGIDDPNDDLLINTTYRVLPAVDIALVVVQPQMLCQQVLKMLKNDILNLGISRLLVLISYDASTNMSVDTRSDVVDTIQAQLRGIGKADVPVKMICYDSSVEGDILNTPTAIHDYITTFLSDNAGKARFEKALFLLKSDIQSRLFQIDAELKLLGQPDDKLAETKQALEVVETNLHLEYKRISTRFQSDISTVSTAACKDFQADCATVVDKFVLGFEGLSLNEAKVRVESMTTLFEPEIREVAIKGFKEVQTTIQSKIESYAREIEGHLTRQLNEQLPVISPNAGTLVADLGIVGRIPTLMVKIADYGLFLLFTPLYGVFGPLGLAITAALRFYAEKVPAIKNWLPESFAAGSVKRSVKQSLEDQIPHIVKNFQTNIDDFARCGQDVLSSVVAEANKQCIQPLRNAVAEAERNISDRGQRKQVLAGEKRTLEDALAILSSNN